VTTDASCSANATSMEKTIDDAKERLG
ncbi:unnamed protein product, partial [Adineta steineri]